MMYIRVYVSRVIYRLGVTVYLMLADTRFRLLIYVLVLGGYVSNIQHKYWFLEGMYRKYNTTIDT